MKEIIKTDQKAYCILLEIMFSYFPSFEINLFSLIKTEDLTKKMDVDKHKY